MPDILTRKQEVQVATVTDVIVTTTEQLEDGSYVRELRVMCKADEGAENQSDVLALTVRLVGEERAHLNFSAPSSEF